MDLGALQNYINMPTVLLCLGFGYIIKKWIKRINNDLIPIIIAIIGVVIYTIMSNFQITLDGFLIGAVSGVMSTGSHQLGKTLARLFENPVGINNQEGGRD